MQKKLFYIYDNVSTFFFVCQKQAVVHSKPSRTRRKTCLIYNYYTSTENNRAPTQANSGEKLYF